jgi:type II secretory pathway component PulF
MEIRHKIKSAMMYPIIVLSFSVLMVFALFFFVLPKFKEIFASMDVEMPPMTSALFAMSDLARALLVRLPRRRVRGVLRDPPLRADHQGPPAHRHGQAARAHRR